MRHASFVFTLLVVILTATTQAQAGHKLYVGSLSLTQGFTRADDSILPPTDLEDLALELPSSNEGTIGSPGASLPASFQLGVIDPDPGGLADAGLFDVYYDGAAGTFPSNSVFDLFTDFTYAGTKVRKKAKTKGPIIVNGGGVLRTVGTTETPTGLELDTFFEGEINSSQPGLTFSDADVVQGISADPFATSFFDIFIELHHDGSGAIDPSQPLFRVTVTTVPEPSTFLLVGLGGVVLCPRRRRC